MSLGTVFRTKDDVVEFLRHTATVLHDVLQKMKGKIEFCLKVNWETEVVFQEIEQEREEIQLLKEEITLKRLASTYFARMQLGRLIEQAIAERADSCVREIYDHLRNDAVAFRHNKPIGEKVILNAVFLISRDHTAEFESRVQEIAKKYDGRLRFSFTSPWPPYNFMNIRLKLERSDVVA